MPCWSPCFDFHLTTDCFDSSAFRYPTACPVYHPVESASRCAEYIKSFIRPDEIKLTTEYLESRRGSDFDSCVQHVHVIIVGAP